MKLVSQKAAMKNKAELEAAGYTLFREGNVTHLSDGVVTLNSTEGEEWDCVREIWRAWGTKNHIHNIRPIAPKRVQP